MLGRDRNLAGATGHTIDGFAAYFTQKIEIVRTATAGRQPSPVNRTAKATFSTFQVETSNTSP